MILAAGLGKRMRPLTDTIPKPLVEVAGRTLLTRALDMIETAGVTRAVINVSYKAPMIEAYLQEAAHARAIVFSREATPLETGGGIVQALGLLGSGPFFSLNADVIVLPGKTHFLSRLWEAWDDAAMDALLLVHPSKAAVGYDGAGDFFLEQGGRLRRDSGQQNAPYVFTGVQLLHPRLFAEAPQGAFSMNVLYERLMRRGKVVRPRP